jgi:hypothetical protein
METKCMPVMVKGNNRLKLNDEMCQGENLLRAWAGDFA